MTWMLTASGRAFDLQFVDTALICLRDIAHHLAQINRYTGACSRPCSVAEHSLLVCEIMERELGERDPSVLLAALMHDAHEAYTNDLSSPMKTVVGPAWHAVENRVQHAVLCKFHLITAWQAHKRAITYCDLAALATEREQLLPPEGPEWAACEGIKPVGWVRLADQARFTWEDWRQAFLDRYAELQFARQARHAAVVATVNAATEPPCSCGNGFTGRSACLSRVGTASDIPSLFRPRSWFDVWPAFASDDAARERRAA